MFSTLVSVQILLFAGALSAEIHLDLTRLRVAFFILFFLPAILSVDAHLLVALSDWRGHSCRIIKNQ